MRPSSERQPHIGTFLHRRFPERSMERIHAALAGVGRVTVYHTAFEQLETLDHPAKQRLADGQLVPVFGNHHAHDVAYWRQHRPKELNEFVEDVCRVTGWTQDDAWAQESLRIACNCARWMQASRPDVLFACLADEPALIVQLAARLLGLPVVWWVEQLPEPDSPLRKLAELYLRHSTTAMVPAAEVQRLRSGARCGFPTEATTPNAPSDLEHAILSATRAAPASPQGGLRAAFSPAASGRSLRSGSRWIVALGAERTGSTMLSRLLNSHPECVSGGELFNPRNAREGLMDWPAREVTESATVHECWARQVPEVLDLLSDRHPEDQRLALKLLYFHGVTSPNVLDVVLRDERIRILHIKRRDRLRRWLSHAIASATDRWSSDKASTHARMKTHPSIRLDPTATLYDFELQKGFEQQFDAMFGDRQLVIPYEEFAADTATWSDRIADHLGLARSTLEVTTVRSESKPLRESIDNYSELQDAFAGTRWADLLKEAPR